MTGGRRLRYLQPVRHKWEKTPQVLRDEAQRQGRLLERARERRPPTDSQASNLITKMTRRS
ncbi:hypothetical protein E4U14_001066 [Claviceps sp. LM454 group G7]|nr:hypothetical protein E4U14_001066 [Claviceps sp. LM454 group G7]